MLENDNDTADMTDTPIGPSDDELEVATRLYRNHFGSAQVVDFDIGPLDRLGHSIVVAGIRTEDGFSNDGFGYGGSAMEAGVGALGEMSETYHVHRALEHAPACEGLSHQAMVKRFGTHSVIDPLTLCLPAGSDYNPALPLRWVELRAWPQGKPVWAPRECIATNPFTYGTRSSNVLMSTEQQSVCLFRPITCGLGAGISLEQALSHGVLELLQRDGNCTRFRAMDQGVDLELDHIEDPGIRKILAKLATQGIRVRPKLASTEFDLVNLYVIGEAIAGSSADADDFPLMATACGEAVHANRERALRKALLEFLAARVRKTFMHGPLEPIRQLAPATYNDNIMAAVDPADEEPRALEAMVGWLGKSATQLRELLSHSVFSTRETRLFSSLPSIPDTAVSDPDNRLADLTVRLRTQDLSVFYLDASPPGEAAPRVVKSVVPNLEGETLSYYRIGERGVHRLLKEEPGLVAIGRMTDDFSLRIPLTAAAETRLGGQAWFNPARAEAIVGSLYPLYREPSSHSAQKRLQEQR